MTYAISNIETYPQNGKHQRIRLNIYPFPLGITKGEDTWYYRDAKDNEKKIKPDLWYVFVHSKEMMLNSKFVTKGFRNPELAVKYALKSYKTWLKEQIKKLDEYQMDEHEV